MTRWAHWSLRRTLLVVLLPGLLAVMGLEIVVSWRNALAAANAAFDRSLLGAIKAMDANISTASGGLSVELPYRMLEFFELTASGQVFYRVASGDGLVEIGDALLPAPPRPLVDAVPQFHDADYFGIPVRVGTYARQLDRPLSQGSHSSRVIIQVAETLESRQDFTRRLVLEAVARDLLLLAAALALVVLAVHAGLRPLQRLRTDVAQRRSDDLTPIRADQVPQEVQPLVDAINQHTQRYQQALHDRRQFIDDASHQLRTPLTTLATQIGFALRETDPAHRELALQAIKTQVDDAIRQTNQMLALARADALEMQVEPLDLHALAERVTRRLWPLARQQGIDLGLEPLGAEPTQARGHGALLEEALANLLHNALVHTPPGGQ
ncbi:MAG: sensor histidine kinase N-terminal domain-containing protein, partial [Burkholderiaceae bacterium]|nr:sensor histidine kinase N-terminal domain-containing protein [Burkholderiaceae bacterium]